MHTDTPALAGVVGGTFCAFSFLVVAASSFACGGVAHASTDMTPDLAWADAADGKRPATSAVERSVRRTKEDVMEGSGMYRPTCWAGRADSSAEGGPAHTDAIHSPPARRGPDRLDRRAGPRSVRVPTR